MRSAESIRYRKMEYFGYGPNVMKKNKVCSRCGVMTDASNRACPECGEKLPDETLFEYYKRQHASCPDCDTVLTPSSLYCPQCGKKINHKEDNIERGGG